MYMYVRTSYMYAISGESSWREVAVDKTILSYTWQPDSKSVGLKTVFQETSFDLNLTTRI